MREQGREGAVLRTALTVCLAAVTLSACTSSTTCADPPLVTTSGNTVTGEFVVHLWQPDGAHEALIGGGVDGGWNGGAVLSPDRSTVAFESAVGEYSDTLGYPQTRVAVLSMQTRDVTVLSADLPNTTVERLHWSADGTEVAFVRYLAAEREIVAVDVEDGEERRLLRLDESSELGAFAWSPDGRELLVPVRTRTHGPDGSLAPEELWRYSIDTGDHELIESSHAFIDDVAWSPDGRLVAMEADTPGTGGPRLYVLDLESGTSTPIDRRRGGPVSMLWSGPYLLYVYAVTGPSETLYLMRWDSRSQERTRLERPAPKEVLDQLASISAPRCDP
jgi:Tol biopolymer transport system component